MRRINPVLVMIMSGCLLSSCVALHRAKSPAASEAMLGAPVAMSPAPVEPPSSNGANRRIAELEAQLKDMAPQLGGGNANVRMGGGSGGANSASDSAQAASVSKPPVKNRKVIYTGSVTLRVANKTTGREEIDRIVRKYDGLIVSATLDEVTFRITPEQFEAAMNDVAQAGEVASKEIKSEDVTDQFFDLALRIDVAEGSRKRLMELLGRSGAVKDVLEVERDLRRLTEEIEQLKGVLRKMQDQIDLATIKVMLQEKQLVAQPRRRAMASTFGWMNQVGLDKLLETIPSEAPLEGESSLHSLFFGPRFRLAVEAKDLLPAGFLPALYDGFDLIGVTAQDHRLRVQQIELRQEGELGIWADALGEEFKSYRGYIIRQREPFKLNDTRLQAIALRCETAVGSETWAYDVWLVQNPDQPKKLLVAEYAREKKAGDDRFAAVEQAIRGIKVH